MKAELYTRGNIASLDFPSTADGDYARRYLLPMMLEGSQKYIRNVHNTEVMIAKVEDLLLPITVTDFHPQNTYTCSPYSHYVSYGGYEEVKHLNNPPLEFIIRLLIRPLAWYFLYTELDRVAYVNNWLLSTNLYPSLRADQLKVLIEALPGWFPDRAVVFRSVDEFRNPLLFNVLQQSGYEMSLSRQVWYMDPIEAIKKQQYKQDTRVLRHHGYEIVDSTSFNDEDLRRALELYNLLYLEKYSHFNPQLTEDFLRLARDAEVLFLRGLNRNGRLDGVMGYFVRNGLMTQPLFGYDTSFPQEEGLYRLLTLVTLQEGLKNNYYVHASGGVGKFKKVRGGKSVIEYNAVYHRHLPAKRQAPWKLIRSGSRFAIPYFQKNDF